MMTRRGRGALGGGMRASVSSGTCVVGNGARRGPGRGRRDARRRRWVGRAPGDQCALGRHDGRPVGVDAGRSGVAVDNVAFTGDAGAGGSSTIPPPRSGWPGCRHVERPRPRRDRAERGVGHGRGSRGQPGDSQLDALLPAGQTTQDAASLTVEFTPTNPQLAINYVFAPEEYEEYVGSQFNRRVRLLSSAGPTARSRPVPPPRSR
jgi:hypothetical protein